MHFKPVCNFLQEIGNGQFLCGNSISFSNTSKIIFLFIGVLIPKFLGVKGLLHWST